jgi:hypothetical protein
MASYQRLEGTLNRFLKNSLVKEQNTIAFVNVTKRLSTKTEDAICCYKVPDDEERVDESSDINPTGFSEEVC